MKLLLLLTLLLSFNVSFASFLPENDMRIPVTNLANDMTYEKFAAVIDKVKDVYKPIVAKKLGILNIQKAWVLDQVNAYARRVGPIYDITVMGGLARHEAINEDGLAMVVCHELGHHLGGAPKVRLLISKWASNEGQSDYFGALKCFRRVFGNDNNIAYIKNLDVPHIVTDKCNEVWRTEKERALCIRTNMAAKSVSDLLASFANEKISFDTPDMSVVDETYNKHPEAQCRLDTYFAATLCTAPLDEKLSKTNPNKGTCSRMKGHEEGVRPLCWYKP